jgi:resuscitation-promoting factor RpfB
MDGTVKQPHDDSSHTAGGVGVLERENASTAAMAPRGGRVRRIVIIAGAAVLVAFSGIGGVTAAAMSNTVTITVDGQAQQISTVASSVEGVLSAAGVEVTEHDSVVPALTAEVSDGGRITVEKARLLTLTIDGAELQVWTTADTVEAALLEISQDPSSVLVSADASRAVDESEPRTSTGSP